MLSIYHRRGGKERGASIVIAIFLMVVMSSIGAFMLNVLSTNQISAGLDATGDAAKQAAAGGIDYAVYRWSVLTVCTNETISVGNYTVVIACVETTHDLDGVTSRVGKVTSIACTAGGLCPNTTNPGVDYVERRMDVVLRR